MRTRLALRERVGVALGVREREDLVLLGPDQQRRQVAAARSACSPAARTGAVDAEAIALATSRSTPASRLAGSA